MRTITLLFLLIATLFSRENPFKSITNENQISNNDIETFEKFKKEEFKLPSSARVIQSIKIVYKNIDGSEGAVTKEFNKEMDWHNPIVVTHEISDIIESKSDDFWRVPMDIPNYQLSIFNRDIKIKTDKKLINDFFQTKPFRVVLDFEDESQGKEDEGNSIITKELNRKFFTKITLSRHEGFTRIELELDSYYKYKKISVDDGLIIGVR